MEKERFTQPLIFSNLHPLPFLSAMDNTQTSVTVQVAILETTFETSAEVTIRFLRS